MADVSQSFQRKVTDFPSAANFNENGHVHGKYYFAKSVNKL